MGWAIGPTEVMQRKRGATAATGRGNDAGESDCGAARFVGGRRRAPGAGDLFLSHPNSLPAGGKKRVAAPPRARFDRR